MGNRASSQKHLPKEQEDIRYLGNRYPFGDDELKRLYRCFYLLKTCPNRCSFLIDWGLHCASDSCSHEVKQQRYEDVKRVEEQILPKGFGQRLERVAFLPSHRGNLVVNDVAVKDDTDNALPTKALEVTAYATSPASAEISCCSCCFQPPKTHPHERMNLIEATAGMNICDDDMEGLEAFLNGAANCGRRGGRKAVEVLYDCCARPKQENTSENEKSQVQDYSTSPFSTTQQEEMVANASMLLDWVYRIALASLFLETAGDEGDDFANKYIPSPDSSNHSGLQALAKSLMEFARKQRQPYGSSFPNDGNDKQELDAFVSKMEFVSWAESTAPMLASALSTLTHGIFFPDKPYPPSRTAFCFPIVSKQSAFFQSPTSPLLFSFACMSSSLGGTWHRLYTSESDGLSFNRLQLSLLGYGGPTLLIIREVTNGGVFGAFTSHAWKETRDFYGNSDCFLFQLLPTTKVYRPSGNGTNYMYCNSEARSKGYDGLAHGIGFGGTTEAPRLFIDESLDDCVASSSDLTFEYGDLFYPGDDGNLIRGGNVKKRFDIDALEVWGVGGDEMVAAALGARDAQREITAANIQKARKVDKAAFLEDFQSGLIESKAFRHRDQIRGRADAAVDDRHKNGYVYEK